MKKLLVFALCLAMLLSLAACGNDTKEPTAESTVCSHTYDDATCTTPKTCSKCGDTEGSAAGHSYHNGSCTKCAEADPNVPFTGSDWTASFVASGTSEEGEVFAQYTLWATELKGYVYKEYYSNINYSFQYYDTVSHEGKTYYDFWCSSEMGGIEWEDNGDTVTVRFSYNSPILEFVLTRTGETQFAVTSSNDTERMPVGTIFHKV